MDTNCLMCQGQEHHSWIDPIQENFCDAHKNLYLHDYLLYVRSGYEDRLERILFGKTQDNTHNIVEACGILDGLYGHTCDIDKYNALQELYNDPYDSDE